MNKFGKIFAASIFGLALAPVSASACEDVSITEMNWASSAAITAIAKFVMEQGYGCSVTKVPSATVTSVASMKETGKPDIATELWTNSAPVYAELKESGVAVTAAQVFSEGGVEGWWVPQYLVDQHPELATIEGILANPALVGGRFHNCPVGWGCRIANDNLKVAYDFEGNGLEVFDHGSGETLASSIASAYANEEPWFGYYWAPTAILGKYPMVKVNVGPHVEETHNCNQTADCATPGKSDFPAAPVMTAVMAEFAQNNPDVFEFLQNMSFTNAQLGEVLAWQEDNSATADETAVYFLTTYTDVWSGWLNDEAKSNLSGILN